MFWLKVQHGVIQNWKVMGLNMQDCMQNMEVAGGEKNFFYLFYASEFNIIEILHFFAILVL